MAVVEPWLGADAAASVARILGPSEEHHVVAVDDTDTLVGVMGVELAGIDPPLYGVGDTPASLINAYVSPERRGEGIGTALADHLEAWAARQGCDRLVVVSGARSRAVGYGFWASRCGPAALVEPDRFGPAVERVTWSCSLPRPPQTTLVRAPALVVDPDPAWPDHFATIRAATSSVLVGTQTTVEHVGSTAVPGLAAKPIIDVLVVVDEPTDLPAVIGRLEAGGWRHQGDLGVRGREAFESRSDLAYHHLYAVIRGTPPHRDVIDFRNHLLRTPKAAAEYAALKRGLAHLLTSDRRAYTDGKADLVARVLRDSRQHSTS